MLYVVVNTPQAGQYGVYNAHECSNHIQHEVEARGLYVVTHECHILQTALLGVC